jgi:hypothetical protein
LVWDQEVAGSNPVTPTDILKAAANQDSPSVSEGLFSFLGMTAAAAVDRRPPPAGGVYRKRYACKTKYAWRGIRHKSILVNHLPLFSVFGIMHAMHNGA